MIPQIGTVSPSPSPLFDLYLKETHGSLLLIEQPNYRPGRFHAHALSTTPTSASPLASSSRATQVTSGAISAPSTSTKRERLKHVGGGAKRFFQRKKKDVANTGRGDEERERERLLNDFNTPRPSATLHTNGRRLFDGPPITTRRAGGTGIKGIREEAEEGREEEEDDSSENTWLLLRPGKKRVKRWMASWWKRWALLVLLPCCIVSTSRCSAESVISEQL